MQLSIILFIIERVNPLNYKIMEQKSIPQIQEPDFNPISSFDVKTFNSGVLFEQISFARVSENQFKGNYNIDVSRLTDRIDLITQYRFELELYCLTLNKRYECNYLIELIQSYISYGEFTMRNLMENNITKFDDPKPFIKLSEIMDERITSFLKDKIVKNIMAHTNFLMTQQSQDAKVFLELLNKIDSTNVMNIFPLDALTQYFYHIKQSMKKDEELLLNIPLIDPQSIFLVSFFNISYSTKLITLHITTPILKKEKFTLQINPYFKQIPQRNHHIGNQPLLLTKRKTNKIYSPKQH